MDYHTETKNLILQDFRQSGKKDLGEFALSVMRTYDDFSYELVIKDAFSYGKPVSGTAVSPQKCSLEKLVKDLDLKGDFKILEIDCQKELFCILAEIRDDLKRR